MKTTTFHRPDLAQPTKPSPTKRSFVDSGTWENSPRQPMPACAYSSSDADSAPQQATPPRR